MRDWRLCPSMHSPEDFHSFAGWGECEPQNHTGDKAAHVRPPGHAAACGGFDGQCLITHQKLDQEPIAQHQHGGQMDGPEEENQVDGRSDISAREGRREPAFRSMCSKAAAKPLTKYRNRNLECPRRSSMLRPKTNRKSMLPIRCNHPACRNMETKMGTMRPARLGIIQPCGVV